MEYKSIKRYLDIISATFGLIFFLPLFLIVGISIKLESKGPIIYKQLRLGLHGNVFTMYKFRTMYLGAEKEGVYELKGDKRVTKVGRILRKTSIDELPQLLNILKGEMSFIGPRPPLTYHPWTFPEYTIAQKKRFMVLPGITGLAQIQGRKDLDWDRRIEYDIEYVDKLSFLLDLKIIFFTILKVFSTKDNLNLSETAKKKEDYPYIKLMYPTNDPKIAKIAEDSGVDWITIDLEIRGKKERQGHLDTLISYHNIEDIKKIKESISKAKIIVRINPMYHGSKEEINRAIEDGADIIMLPYFKTKKEVEDFIRYVNKRAEICLLFETPEAVKNMDDILNIPGINYVHIGINDLSIGYKRKFMFSLLADGTVEEICNKFREKGIPYGFGGIARLGHGMLPAEYILGEIYRLGSSMAIVSRSFCNVHRKDDYEMIEKIFKEGVRDIRRFEDELRKKDYRYFLKNQRVLKAKVAEIEENMKNPIEVKKEDRLKEAKNKRNKRYSYCILTTMSSSIDYWIKPLLPLYNKQGFDLTVICNMTPEYKEELLKNYPYIKAISIPMPRGIDFFGSIKSIYLLYKAFRKGKYHMVQYSTPNASCYGAIAAYLARIPIRLYCQWGMVHVTMKGIKRIIFQIIERIKCLLSTHVQPDSFGNLNYCRKRLFYSKKKSCVIWNGSAKGVDLDKFDIKKKEIYGREIRRQYGINQESIVLGFVGRLGKEKGCVELFEAFKLLEAKYPNLRLLFVGPIERADTINPELMDWFYKNKRIIKTGKVSDVEKYMAAMDIFILPSYREGFGMSVVEAQAMGVAVIVTDIPGPTNGMIAGVSGLTIPVKDIKALVAAARDLINNEEKRKKFGYAGYEYVKNHFDSKIFLKKLLKN